MMVRIVVTGSLLLLFPLACSDAPRPPPYSGGSGTSGGTGVFAVEDGGPKEVPRCSVPTAEVCDCVEMPLSGEPPNLYFVLDHSGSMQRDNLWSSVATVTLEVMGKIGTRGKFGAAMFPEPTGDSCTAGLEIMSTRLGDPPGTYGPVAKFLADRTLSVPPNGGTPTAGTLRKLTPIVRALSGKTFMVLATDGGPNCNESNSCTAARCMANIEGYNMCTPSGPSCCDQAPAACLDDVETLNAVRALKLAGIPTFVLGVPGSDPYADLLNRLAIEGGTARTGADQYYRVNTTDKAAFSKALTQVAAKIVATCTLTLTGTPSDLTKVNVYLDQKPLPKDPVNGWKIEDKTVTLLGSACESVLAGDVLDVRVIAGCRTIEPR
jgi:hypothetical protein